MTSYVYMLRVVKHDFVKSSHAEGDLTYLIDNEDDLRSSGLLSSHLH